MDIPEIRSASVEPPRTMSPPPLPKEPELRPEFGAYWRKAHMILRAIPQVKNKDGGRFETIDIIFLWLI